MKKKLPTIGTSAALTAFCSERIEGPDGTCLYVDGNGKIARENGTLDAPRPNAFSLVQVADCPGSTATCRASCYVWGLEKHAPATHALYKHNSSEIRRILADGEMGMEWAEIMGAWMREHVTSFRWHVSGDVFSTEYAQWIAEVCREAPDVAHWIYTRSFEHLAPLAEVSTLRGGPLAINLSCDRDNYEAAKAASIEYGNEWLGVPTRTLRLCYLTRDGKVPDDLPDGSVIFPDYDLRGGTEAGREWFAALPADYKSYVCPVDYHGKAENRRCGPCARCLT